MTRSSIAPRLRQNSRFSAGAPLAGLLFAAFLTLLPVPCAAQGNGTKVTGAPGAGGVIGGMAKLSKAETADVFRIQSYLNSLRTLSSRFLQVSSAGDYSEGTLSFSKPGKMRLEYDDPNPAMIVSDGVNLAYYDKELKQVSYFDLQATQAALLLNDRISFSSGEILITSFERGPGVFRLTVIKGNNPLEGNMTLIFSDRPLSLKKWTITDAQGVVTNISLLNPRFGAPVSEKLFSIEFPAETQEIQ